jgi:hypothetical protein
MTKRKYLNLSALVVAVAASCSKTSSTESTKQGQPPKPAQVKVVEPTPAAPVTTGSAAGEKPTPSVGSAAPTTPPKEPSLFSSPGIAHGVVTVDAPYDLVTAGLPAISADGKQIVAMSEGDDGGRGYLIASAVILNDKGKVTKTISLAEPSDFADEKTNTERTPADQKARLFPRITEINGLFAAGTWRSMQTVAGKFDETTPPMSALWNDVKFELNMDKLTVSVFKADKPVATRPISVTKSSKGKSNDVPCSFEVGYLKGVHVDETAKSALIEVGYHGGHNCGASAAEFAVVALP